MTLLKATFQCIVYIVHLPHIPSFGIPHASKFSHVPHCIIKILMNKLYSCCFQLDDKIWWKFTFGIDFVSLFVRNWTGCLYDFMINESFAFGLALGLFMTDVSQFLFWRLTKLRRRQMFVKGKTESLFGNLNLLKMRNLLRKVTQRFGANYYYW